MCFFRTNMSLRGTTVYHPGAEGKRCRNQSSALDACWVFLPFWCEISGVAGKHSNTKKITWNVRGHQVKICKNMICHGKQFGMMSGWFSVYNSKQLIEMCQKLSKYILAVHCWFMKGMWFTPQLCLSSEVEMQTKNDLINDVHSDHCTRYHCYTWGGCWLFRPTFLLCYHAVSQENKSTSFLNKTCLYI